MAVGRFQAGSASSVVVLATTFPAAAILVVDKFQRGEFKMLGEAKVLDAKCSAGCGCTRSRMCCNLA